MYKRLQIPQPAHARQMRVSESEMGGIMTICFYMIRYELFVATITPTVTKSGRKENRNRLVSLLFGAIKKNTFHGSNFIDFYDA